MNELAQSLLAGLQSESDSDDDRFEEQAQALEDSDCFGDDAERPPVIPNRLLTSKSWFFKGAGTCKPGQRADLTHCTPASDNPSPGSGQQAPPSHSKGRAKKQGRMVAARRIEKNKETGEPAKVILSTGEPAPAHILPKMVLPIWTHVQIALDPNSDIYVKAIGPKRRGSKEKMKKVTYSPDFLSRNEGNKFARIQEFLTKAESISEEIQRQRQKPQVKDYADCAFLMQEQATRVATGSENRGLKEFFGVPLTPENVVVVKTKIKNKKGKVTGTKEVLNLRINGTDIPIIRPGTKEQLLHRLKNKQPLLDSTYWLQSHGATTLLGRHIVERVDGVHLEFVGKEGVWNDHLITDPDLATMLLQRKKSSGESGRLFDVAYSKLDKYVRSLDGGKFTSKDFRTGRATHEAVLLIQSQKAPKTKEQYDAAIVEVCKKVSSLLGNKAKQAFDSYIDPTVWSSWRAGLSESLDEKYEPKIPSKNLL